MLSSFYIPRLGPRLGCDACSRSATTRARSLAASRARARACHSRSCLDGVTFDGKTFLNADAALYSDGSQSV
jgi:hypothetical protein